jgi:hypothetical protein
VARGLVIAGCVVAVVAMIAAWARGQLLDTHRWVDTSAAVLADPHVQSATAAYLADQLELAPQTSAAVRRVLPSRLAPLAGPVTGVLGDVAEKAALRALRSGAFQRVWRSANRVAHNQLIAVVDGHAVVGGGVVLDLRPMLVRLAARVGLGPKALAALPGNRGVVRVLRANQVEGVQDGAQILRALAWWSAALCLLLLAGGIGVARRRRGALLICGAGLLMAGLVVLVLRRVGGDALIGALTPDGAAGEQAGDAAWRITTGFLAHIAQAVMILGLLLLTGAWLLGPARWASGIRGAFVPWIQRNPLAAHTSAAALTFGLIALGLLPWTSFLVADIIYLTLSALLVEALRRSWTSGEARTPAVAR